MKNNWYVTTYTPYTYINTINMVGEEATTFRLIPVIHVCYYYDNSPPPCSPQSRWPRSVSAAIPTTHNQTSRIRTPGLVQAPPRGQAGSVMRPQPSFPDPLPHLDGGQVGGDAGPDTPCRPAVDPLWTPCGPPVDRLWIPCGPPVDPL
eukprot:1185751-Prorocentrum_minimum.AAC.2